MTDFIEFEVDEDEVMRGLDLQERWMKSILRDMLDDLADKGIEILQGYAPSDMSGDMSVHGTGYTQRHIDRGGVHWVPGGAGGGGGYEVIFGVKAGSSYHPVYVNRGTGIYGGPSNREIESPRGRLMYFYSFRLGHIISVYKVAGQKPQHFLYDTWQDLTLFAQAHLVARAAGAVL